MQIRKCRKADIAAAGAFYDRVVLWLDGHINYPKWIYRVYPSERFVREMTETGAQYICLEGPAIVGAFVLNTDPQGAYEKGNWSRDLPEGSYLVLHALAVDPDLQGRGIGAEISRVFAENGWKVLVHCNESVSAAEDFCRVSFDETDPVPEAARLAVLLMVSHYYEERDNPDMTIYHTMREAFENLLYPHREPAKMF